MTSAWAKACEWEWNQAWNKIRNSLEKDLKKYDNKLGRLFYQ